MRGNVGKSLERRSRGFALAEALVSLLVLSVGLLGVAAMQLKALQASQIGYQRSLASLIAIDGQERVWNEFVRLGKECPTASAVNSEWLDYWQDAVALMNAESGSLTTEISDAGDPCLYNLVVSWEDQRVGKVPEECDEEDKDEEGNCPFEPEETEMKYAFRLPVIG